MRDVLLATYSFYPYHWGGTEVYVHGLAKYLLARGYRVKIIAAVPWSAFETCEMIYEDDWLKIGSYEYSGFEVIGCYIDPSTEEIYSRYQPDWTKSWLSFFKKYWGIVSFDLFHMHANTPLISAALSAAIKMHSPKVKTLFSYHVTDSCPKGTLLYFNKRTCSVKPDLKTCSACVINERWGLNETAAKIVAPLWPDQFFPKNTPARLRPKYLTKLALESFDRFSKYIDHWHVFSPQIEKALNNLSVNSADISVIRHGANDHYLTAPKRNRKASPVVFTYVGRFKKLKGLHTLLEAWLGLEEQADRKLWIIGSGSDLEPDLEKLIEKARERADISFLGTKNVREMRNKLDRTHCLIIPSEVVETGPMVFHEGMARGVNVIASDMGGCASLAAYYGEGCSLFKAGNEKALQKNIATFRYKPVVKEVLGQHDHYTSLFRVVQQLLGDKTEYVTV